MTFGNDSSLPKMNLASVEFWACRERLQSPRPLFSTDIDNVQTAIE